MRDKATRTSTSTIPAFIFQGRLPNPFVHRTLYSSYSMDNQLLSPPALSPPSCDPLPSLVPAFPYTPNIRVPPPPILPELPLRERRGFIEFIQITPRTAFAVPMPAKGHLEPKTGGLPRRRRASAKPVITTHTISKSRKIGLVASSESSDEED